MMRPSKLRASASAAIFIALLRLPVAHAQSNDTALAETLFREGRALLEAGQTSAACAKLEASYRLEARLGTLMNLAACHELEGKTATAWGEFLDAARQARARNTAESKKLEQTAQERAAELEPKMHRLELQIDARVPDLVLTLDERALIPAAWSTPLPIDPGHHVLVASAPGYDAQKIPIDIGGAARRSRVRIPVLVKTAVKEKPKPPPAAVEPTPEPSRFERPLFWAAGGVAIAAAGVGTFFGIRALDAKDARDNACDGGTCPADGIVHQRDAFDAATASTVLFAVSAAAATVAIVALVWPTTDPRSASLSRAGFRF
jgi:hypothetical protein